MSHLDLLPATLRVPQVAVLLGVGRDHAYALAAGDGLPVPVLRLGRALRVATRPLLDSLGLSESDAAVLLGLSTGSTVTPDCVGGAVASIVAGQTDEMAPQPLACPAGTPSSAPS